MNLASTTLTRFGQVGDRADLDNGIAKYGEALELMPPGYPMRSSNLVNLGTALFTRFIQAGHRVDLDDSITRHGEALELIPPGHPLRSLNLRSLALALSTSARVITTVTLMYVLPSSLFTWNTYVYALPINQPFQM